MRQSITQKKLFFFFIGTTAELIKISPVFKAFKRRSIGFKIINSGQNTLNFDELKPIIGKHVASYTIRLKSIKLSKNLYIRFIIWMIKAFINHMLFFGNELRGIDRKKTFFIVHGDTISSLLGAIVSKVYRLRLVHIESGLRSYNFFEPFPEEFCRFIVSKLADIHFCPNTWAVNNLNKSRGIKINTIQNTLIESLSLGLKVNKSSKWEKMLNNKKFFLLILHRQEHILFKKELTKNFIKIITDSANNDLICVFVLHKLTEKFLKEEGILKKIKQNKNIFLFPRLPYIEFMQIMAKTEFIATDGGSNQEEAYYMGKPCLILRDATERIEGLGKNALLSHANVKIVRDFLKNYRKYQRKPVSFVTPPSKIIVDYLLKT